MSLQPISHKAYRATVNYSTPPDRQPAPEQGQQVVARATWKMDEDEMFPGEFACYIEEPAGFPLWLPQRDLIFHEEVATP